MQVTFGWRGSWFIDQIAAENITSSNARSKQSAMTGDGCSFASQSARTVSRASATTGCSVSATAASSCSCCSAVATGCPRIGRLSHTREIAGS